MTLVGSVLRLFARTFVMTLAVFASLVTMVFGLSVLGGATADSSEEVVSASDYAHVTGTEGSANRLLAIAVQGPILGHPPHDSLLGDWLVDGIAYGYRIQQELLDAADDDSVKGIFLEVDTPGGTIFGSQAIFDGLRSYREKTGRPVVAHVEGLAASGGVWAMVGADEIYADYGTGIGSIGVIGPMLTFYDDPTAFDGGLLGGGVTTRKVIDLVLVSAGRGKDFGNPFRRPTQEELKVTQASVDAAYHLFTAHVAAARHLDVEVVEHRIGAFLYGNEAAQELGLIDGTRGRTQAIRALAEKAGVHDDYALVRGRRRERSLLATLFASLGEAPQPRRGYAAGVAARDLCGSLRLGALVYHGDPRALCAAQHGAAPISP
jgi:protease-4